MGIEEIKKEILEKAKNLTKSSAKEAERERDSIMKAAEDSIQKLKEKSEKDADYVIEQYRLANIAGVTSAIKKEKLNVEKEIMAEVLAKAQEKLSALNSAARKKHFEKMLKAGKDYSRVFCSKKDVQLIKSKPETADILGGLILENKEGTMRIDMSYDNLLSQAKDETLAEVSRMLFE